MSEESGSLRIILLVILAVAILALAIVAALTIKSQFGQDQDKVALSPSPAASTSPTPVPFKTASEAAQLLQQAASGSAKTQYYQTNGTGPNCVPTPQQPLCAPKPQP